MTGFFKWDESFRAIAIIVFTVIGLFGSASALIFNIKSYAGKKSVYMMNTTSDPITFFRIADSTMVAYEHLQKDTVNSVVGITVDARELTLNNNPPLLVWLLAMIMMSAIAIGMLPVVISEIHALWHRFKPTAGDVKTIVSLALIVTIGASVLSGGNSGIVFSGLAMMKKFDLLLYSVWPVQLIIIVVVVTGGTAILGILLINSSIGKLTLKNGSVGIELSENIEYLGESLKFFLTFVSILIIFSIVTTSLLQQSLQNEVEIIGFDFFPSEFIYAYGLMFTIFLAIIYIPVYQNFKYKGEQVLNQLQNSGHYDSSTAEKIRQSIIKESPVKNLQILLTILAPAISGVFSEALKHFSG